MPLLINDIIIDEEESLQAQTEAFKASTPRLSAVLCDRVGIFDVAGIPTDSRDPNKPGHNFALIHGDGVPTSYRNRAKVPQWGGLPVYLGFVEDSNEMEIISINYDFLPQGFTGETIEEGERHAERHLMGGDDALFIYPRATTWLRTTPQEGTLFIDVLPHVYRTTDAGLITFYPGEQGLDLTSFMPTIGNARMVCAYLDNDTNLVAFTTGVETPDIPSQLPTFPPDPPIRSHPSAYITLRDGQTLLESDIIDVRQFQNIEIDPKAMHWERSWVSQEYLKHDVVIDGSFTMIANKTTTDRAAPQPITGIAFLLPDAPTWTINAVADVVITGMRMTAFLGLFVISEFRMWVEDITGSTQYTPIFRDLISGVDSIGGTFDGSLLSAPAWVTVTLPDLVVGPGSEIEILVIADNHASITQFVGPWVLTASQNDFIPLSGGVHRRTNRTTIWFHKTDNDVVDRSAELLSVIPGTTITSTLGAAYQVVNVVDGGTYVSYDITGTDPGTLGLQTWTFDVPVPTLTDIVSLPGFWTANPLADATIQGVYLETSSPPTVLDDTAFGVDLQFQEFALSPDWDIVAISSSGGGAGGGGGVDTYLALTDTPINFGAGAHFFPKINTGQLALEHVLVVEESATPPVTSYPGKLWFEPTVVQAFDLGEVIDDLIVQEVLDLDAEIAWLESLADPLLGNLTATRAVVRRIAENQEHILKFFRELRDTIV